MSSDCFQCFGKTPIPKNDAVVIVREENREEHVKAQVDEFIRYRVKSAAPLKISEIDSCIKSAKNLHFNTGVDDDDGGIFENMKRS
jgi:hypothetical protein